ncbi:OadG-related small transporter subunit [Enterococcus timonensis]|nr:OadG-related small transporter subunit [Enterococcus timonensis]
MTENLKSAFELLVFGWGGVFLVLFILYLFSKLLLKIFPVKKEKGSD